tara:strand:- start:3231 stop:3752 length:522 start_codon:yes stop_codon:yes gene_type:complete
MVLALHNPDEMGTGRYDLKVDIATPRTKNEGALETPGAPKKKKSERPNPDLETATVNNNVQVQGLGDMKDQESWRDDKETGIRHDMYSSEVTKNRFVKDPPPIQRRTEEERKEFERGYNPDKEIEGIGFGGITKTRRRRKKANKKTKKNKRQTKKQPKKKNKKTLKASKRKKK